MYWIILFLIVKSIIALISLVDYDRFFIYYTNYVFTMVIIVVYSNVL